MLDIGKIAVLLLTPFGSFLGLTLLATLLLARRHSRSAAWVFACGFGWLLLWSLPVASMALRQSLEQRFPPRPAAEYPIVDAIVVLGGGMSGAAPPWRDGPHLHAGADRYWFAAQLYHAGRAPLLIVSGGNNGWSDSAEAEASAMAAFEQALGVPAEAIWREDESRSTGENARFAGRLLHAHDLHRILLVTSALHMPRALALFRAQGIETIPAPTDFDAAPLRSWRQWLPDAQTLDRSGRAMKEYLGLAMLRLRSQ